MKKQSLSLMLSLLIVSSVNVFAQNSSPQAETSSVAMEKASEMESAVNPLQRDTDSAVAHNFGIQFGQHFDLSMVDSVIERQQHDGTGKPGSGLKGEIVQVIPLESDRRFQLYRLKTSQDGIIYAVIAEFQFEVEPALGKKMGRIKGARDVRRECKQQVKELALELEASYGKPRGKGWDGEWFSFRRLSESEDTSLSLYANRCRTGLYSVVITDEKLVKKLKRG